MCCCFFASLATRQESNARHCGRDRVAEAADGLFGHFFNRGFARLLAVDNHVRFQDHTFKSDACVVEFCENGLEHPFGDFVATVDGMIARLAIHQHFRLNDWHDTRFLTECRITGEGLRVLLDRSPCRKPIRDGNHSAPFRKACANAIIFVEALTQAIKTFRDGFTVKTCKRFCTGVNLDAWNSTRLADKIDKWCAVFGLLTNGFIIEDDARNVILHRVVRAEQHLAIIAARILSRGEADAFKTLCDGAGAFIRSQNPFAVCDECNCNIFKTFGHVLAP